MPIYDFKGRNERRPSDPDDKILKRILKQNLRQSTRDIVKRLNTSQSTVYRYLKKLGKVSKNKEKSHVNRHKSVVTDKNRVFFRII